MSEAIKYMFAGLPVVLLHPHQQIEIGIFVMISPRFGAIELDREHFAAEYLSQPQQVFPQGPASPGPSDDATDRESLPTSMGS
ncbi:hypothetical protein [Candidatus Amarolinea dominans]|uniref:hypothetical protein n=1 Tax=Candidatus Amarolinea dominans TaxID=3140696 RepID=UPI0031CC3E44